MPYEVLSGRADPVLDMMVGDPAQPGRQRRLTVLSGLVTVGPPAARGFEIRVHGSEPKGEQVGFYLTDAEPLPSAGEVIATAEVSLVRLTVIGTTSHEVTYGVGEAAVDLVADDTRGGQRWPYLRFICFGMRALSLRYRVTLLRDAPA